MLTLPTIRALRIAFPHSYIEVPGYKHIVEVALNPQHANATSSIESATLAPFFARDGELPAQLATHFAGFDLIISYLFDPDGIFAANLKRAGAQRIVHGPAKLSANEHAAVQLARPLHELRVPISNFAAEIPFSAQRGNAIALHPGSGSVKKNWPVEHWINLAKQLGRERVLLVGGEADTAQLALLRPYAARTAINLSLCELAARVADCVAFVGHDSGVSHIAAATGVQCTLLFGPTDPAVWAPLNDNVRVLRAPEDELDRIAVSDVVQELMRIGIST